MIYVIAYFANNLGDDLFVRELVRRYPEEKFYLCADTPQYLKCFEKEKNVHIVKGAEYYFVRIMNRMKRYKGPIRNFIMLRFAKATVRIGGSVFIETDGWNKKIISNEGKKLYVIGANFGPYYTDEYKEAISKKIEKSTDCCFRDYYSYELFREISQVRYAPDILFSYNDCIDVDDNNNCIGLSVINLKGRNNISLYAERYESGIVEICNYYLRKNYKIKFFCFCKAEGDTFAIERIMNMILRSSDVELVCYNGEIDNFLKELKTCSILFATRFHAMILGWLFRKTVVPIIYSSKQLNVIQDLKFSGWCWNISEGEMLPDDWSEKILPSSYSFIDDAIMNSEKNFYYLDKFLKK